MLGALVSLGNAVVRAAEELPAWSTDVALAVTVPSVSEEALMPVTVIVPGPVVAGAVNAFVLLSPFVSVTFTVSVFCEVASRPTETLTADAVDAFTALLEPWPLARAMVVGGTGAPTSFETLAVVGSEAP